MLRFSVATLFPDMCESALSYSILGRAQNQGLVSVEIHNIRDFTTDKHKRVDDMPYGGGRGMIIQADPIFRCYEFVRSKFSGELRVVYLSPQGKTFNQRKALELSRFDGMVFLICGHYEGVDQRILDEIVDEEISIGDYILTGGELSALVVVDAVARLLPGVLASPDCFEKESHFDGLLEYPQYTRPAVWRGRSVPEVLLSGNHLDIKKWQKRKSIEATLTKRPDILKNNC